MSNDVISVPLDFCRGNDFCRLQLATRDGAPILLGRLIAIAMAVAGQQRVRFAVAELDHLVCWPTVATGRPSFSQFLEGVGWAREVTGGSVDVALPAEIQHVNPKRLAGRARAEGAGRDERGRYLRPPGADPRKPRPPRIALDAEGHPTAVPGKGVAG